MANEQQYFTLDNEPPHGAIPTDRISVAVPIPQRAEPADNGPPNGGRPRGYPAAYAAAAAPMDCVVPLPAAVPYYQYPIVPVTPFPCIGGLPYRPAIMPAPATGCPHPAPVPVQQLQAQTPRPPPALSLYEPPGQWGPGGAFHEEDGASYIFSNHITHDGPTTICFIGDGVRPCDHDYYPHRFRFSKHQVPSNMLIGDLIRKLGCPAGGQNGVSEVTHLGEDRWGLLATYTQGGGMVRRTVSMVGWGPHRGEGNPVWLVVKR